MEYVDYNSMSLFATNDAICYVYLASFLDIYLIFVGFSVELYFRYELKLIVRYVFMLSCTKLGTFADEILLIFPS